MTCRAILIDPEKASQERPVQIYGNDPTEIDRWAQEVLRSASENSTVEVFKWQEVKEKVIGNDRARAAEDNQ